jgi:hypothetical protein
MKITKTLFLALTLMLAATVNSAPSMAKNSTGISAGHPMATPINQNDFRATVRKLFEDHVSWGRLLLVSSAASLPDRDATLARMLQNQQDIGAAIVPFYGQDASNKLTQLLTDHVTLGGKLLDAVKSGDGTILDNANSLWLANGDQIAAFLNSVNPKFWVLADLKSMLSSHLQLETKEIQDYVHGNYANSVADHDEAVVQALSMADVLSSGIIQQFPDYFTNGETLR